MKKLPESPDGSVRKTLGLDLGSNSLGWAVIDSDRGTILDTGVVVFDEGIVRVKGADTLSTPASVRRIARMGRRLRYRRRLRKFALLRTLIANGMCPMSPESLDAWAKKGIYPLSDKAFRDWLHSSPEDNPYRDRAMAADGPVDKLTLGRALYHIAQRRGFLSSRKEAMEKEDDEELGRVKSSIRDLTEEIRSGGDNRTLGQYFYECYRDGVKVRGRYTGRKEHYMAEFARIAEVQKLPQALVDELHHNLFFQRPLRSQKRFVGNCPLEPNRPRCMLLRPEFEEYRMLALVNSIRVDPSGVNRPLSHEERSRAIAAFYKVERYIKMEDVEKAIFGGGRGRARGRTASPGINFKPFKTASTCSVSQQLNNLFGTKGGGFRDWFHDGANAAGKPVRYDYRAVLDAISFFQDDDKLRDFGKVRLGFTDEQADRLVKIRFPEGYAKLSLAAIGRILPFLRKGLDLHMAILLAKFPDILGADRFAAEEDRILDKITFLYEDVRENRQAAFKNRNVSVIPLRRRVADWLSTEFGVGPDETATLYDTLSQSDYDDCRANGVLPPVELGMLRNPLVQRSMTILRRLVNRLRWEEVIDADTHIHVELARNVNDRNTRLAWEAWQKQRQDARAAAAAKLAEAGIENPSGDLVLRVCLAEEQNWKCLYTGRAISLSELVSENSGFDVEHTVPRSRSGDDGQANKTLCDARFNRETKRGRLPAECLDEDTLAAMLRPWRERRDALEKTFARQMSAARAVSSASPDAKARARQKALATRFELDYWRRKIRYFEVTQDDLGDGFMNRQLVDTGIMSRHAVDFLSSVYRRDDGRPNVWAVNGAATAFARKAWGVQDTESPKLRTNHVHHAIDAMVVACLSRSRFTEICSRLKDDTRDTSSLFGREGAIPPPCPGFAEMVRRAAESIFVRHLSFHKETKQTARRSWPLAHPAETAAGLLREVPTGGDTVRGPLHKDTFFGRIALPGSGEETFVVRKPVSDAGTFKTPADFDKIVDPAVREAVRGQVQSFVDSGRSFAEVMKALADPASGICLWMKRPDAEGRGGVPIRKVRIKAHKSSARELKRQVFPSNRECKNAYWVDSAEGTNFRLAVYERGLAIDNLLDWAQTGGTPPDAAERASLGAFRGYLRSGSMVLLYNRTPDELNGIPPKEIANHLHVIYKYYYSGNVVRVFLRKHDCAIPDSDLGKDIPKHTFSSFPEMRFYLTARELLEHGLLEGLDFALSISGSLERIQP